MESLIETNSTFISSNTVSLLVSLRVCSDAFEALSMRNDSITLTKGTILISAAAILTLHFLVFFSYSIVLFTNPFL